MAKAENEAIAHTHKYISNEMLSPIKVIQDMIKGLQDIHHGESFFNQTLI